jgi:hypothetical protein
MSAEQTIAAAAAAAAASVDILARHGSVTSRESRVYTAVLVGLLAPVCALWAQGWESR